MASIEFDGRKYCPKGVYYYNSYTRRHLHQAVWEKYNGKIPEGYQVHHKDHNPQNNDISNLELLPSGEHQRHHGAMLTDEQRKMYADNIVKNGMPKAKEWHHSEEGREWHRKHGIEVATHLEPVTYECSYCGKEFSTKNRYSETSNHFCSNKCRAAYRRKSGVDNETRFCEICGDAFEVNKYGKRRFCKKHRNCRN